LCHCAHFVFALAAVQDEFDDQIEDEKGAENETPPGEDYADNDDGSGAVPTPASSSSTIKAPQSTARQSARKSSAKKKATPKSAIKSAIKSAKQVTHFAATTRLLRMRADAHPHTRTHAHDGIIRQHPNAHVPSPLPIYLFTLH
jgi:hypothetical protein